MIKKINEFLGVKKYKFGLAEEQNQIGVATGLAWTEVGGDLLSIEAIKLPGKGRMKATGKLGDVMKESMDAASSFVRSKSPDFGVKPTVFERSDIHVHVPEGATLQRWALCWDSHGNIYCVYANDVPIKRDVAMTGEVTLRGNVLAIGGLKRETVGCSKGGIKTVIIPKENVKDLVDIPENVKNSLEIIPVSHVSEVLKVALIKKLVSIDWDFNDHENNDKLKAHPAEGAELPN